MSQAWLDSLSEDWPSQHEADASAQLPALKTESAKKQFSSPSRIPRRTQGGKGPALSAHDSSVNVLSERSGNDINISMQRVASRAAPPAKDTVRSGSSNNGSVVHNTVAHRSSLGGGQDETPEWKRRLVNGDIQYGEQRDLFSSAKVGLQDMFKPPTPPEQLPQDYNEPQPEPDNTLASSPPTLSRRPSIELEVEADTWYEEEEQYHDDVTPSPSPRWNKRQVNYDFNADESHFPSTPPSMNTHQQPAATGDDEIYRDLSCLSVPPAADAVDDPTRKISGQSALQHEDFSPIYIGKHNGEEGKIDFAPVEFPADQLKAKLERLRINQHLLFESEANVQDAFDAEGVPGGTGDFARKGGFINMQRGGISSENSFLNRGLSLSLGVDSSEMLLEESLQASTPKQFPTIRTEANSTFHHQMVPPSPSMPRAPFPSPEKRQTRNRNVGSGGSPLKLFGPYDTFTNQTLLRRISQFEEGMSHGTQRQSSAFRQPSVAHAHLHHLRNELHCESSSLGDLSQFGSGDLDGYGFGAEDEESKISDDKENVSPQLPAVRVQLPSAESSQDSSELFLRRRREKSTSSSASRIRHRHTRSRSNGTPIHQYTSHPLSAPEFDGTTNPDISSEGKRPRTSPSKDPTPKRRRTLHRSDIAFGREEIAGVNLAHGQFQSAMKKQRRDRQPSSFQLADKNVLAMRSLLYPRSPSGNLLYPNAAGPAAAHNPKRSPLQALHGDSLSPMHERERKPSIRTQDFVDQAAQIMAMIRNQVRPPGLTSVEESAIEYSKETLDFSDEPRSDSTGEPLSRPPSREGGRTFARPPPRQQDPELIQRLQMYQEASEMGDLALSMTSGTSPKGPARGTEEDAFETDIPGIRLSVGTGDDGGPRSPLREFSSTSSGYSASRDYRTISSRGSDFRRTIMPESVSHLIPERVGSMCLDKNTNVWVKTKETRQLFQAPPASMDVSELSEEDPFASIPDLSVDLTKEMAQLRLTSAETVTRGPAVSESPDSPPKLPRSTPGRGFVTLPPNGLLTPAVGTLARNEFRKLGELQHESSPSSRSDGDVAEAEAFAGRSPIPRRRMTISFSSPVASIIRDVQAEDLDNLEDDPDTPRPQASPSPPPSAHKTLGDAGRPSTSAGVPPSPGQSGLKNRTAHSRPHTAPNGAFIRRPVSRIDEQDEESTVELPQEDQHQLSIIGETSLVSHRTPASMSFLMSHHNDQGALSLRADDSAFIGQNVGKLSLSPLSEFTLNNYDQSFGFEVSYVVGRRHMETGDGNKKVMSMTIRNLVDKLSEVEPCEPFWQDITELDLQEKKLTSLHMLDEFCGKIVTLDASKNSLGHLDGVPHSVRQLKVSHNMLTELTSWDHLHNLQYIDISDNEVRSLSALKNLVHLRSIKADNNQLTDLDGLDCHDGILSLRARNNQIQDLDFGKINLERLIELDLSGNQITSVQNLEVMPALAKLKLSKNHLGSFSSIGIVKTLKHLDLSDNWLTCLDVSSLPNIQSLHADRNYLTSIKGSSRARKLDSLSLREQRADEPLDLSFLSAAYEVRKLFVSGNRLDKFDPQVDLLNLQLLELANCGLIALPENIGQLMPNLRTLNLNFNAIVDLSPLRFIPRLKKLLVAANRLVDSTKVTELLTDFPHLTQLDLRDNPITLGFYAPLQVLVSQDATGEGEPFVLPGADVEKDRVFSKRLDEPTRLRRRLHQVVFGVSCKRLKVLDGLPIKRGDVLTRDEVMETLIDEQLLPNLEDLINGTPTSSPRKVEDWQRVKNAAAEEEAAAKAAKGV
ncbi:hypothetical protein N3K66_003899 [Trichothecium roseum]|uniref:Uncharacterized protein n=1 Tax=Trichothecium roseum TaxID=47278 RepID=A0ACC0V7H5_9HYPO|nr:hypothetical protein N3K66_003899 [Trichothecium roseum]